MALTELASISERRLERMVEFHLPLEPGAGGRAACRFIRSLAPRLLEDRSLAAEIERVAQAVRSGEVVGAVEAAVGGLA